MQTHIIAKTIVFDDDGRLLVLRRSADDEHRPGGSDFPGGKVEEGENIFEGAAREMAEEAGLRLAPADFQLIFATTKVDYNTDAKTVVNMVWLGLLAGLPKGQTVSLSHEHQAFGWFTLEEALANSDAPTQKMFMEHLRDHNLAPQLMTSNKGNSHDG
jgi:8-oxo-dGTP pyrophosphatase MutT (NUDIX family)